MELKLSRFYADDIDTVYAIQRAAFKPLYETYRDDSTSPYTEPKETVLQKYMRDGTAGYLFWCGKTVVGAVRIRISDADKSARVSVLCVLPAYQGRGIAQNALLQIERLHPDIDK